MEMRNNSRKTRQNGVKLINILRFMREFFSFTFRAEQRVQDEDPEQQNPIMICKRF